MYTVQSTAPPRRYTWQILTGVLIVIALGIGANVALDAMGLTRQVVLYAEAGNTVTIWDSLQDTVGVQTPSAQLPDGTLCRKINANQYKSGNGNSAIYYYWLNCNGRQGYVEIDHVR